MAILTKAYCKFYAAFVCELRFSIRILCGSAFEWRGHIFHHGYSLAWSDNREKNFFGVSLFISFSVSLLCNKKGFFAFFNLKCAKRNSSQENYAKNNGEQNESNEKKAATATAVVVK